MAMKAEEALAIAKSYTKKSLIGQGAIQGQDGKTPYIDPTTKHWFIDGVDTGVLAEGTQGQQGISPTIDPVSKHWMIGTIDTGVVAEGVNGVDGTDGTDGADGTDGFSPTVVVNPLNTTSDYRLDITTIGGTFTTPNLIGAQGQQGVPGTSAVSAINPRGDYDVNATPNYTTNDYVTYTDGNTYVCKVDNPTNIAPTDGRNNDPFWQIIAMRGADGVQGADGQPGVNGTTFIPSIDVNGNVSWTNNGGLVNPATVNVKGADGITYTPKIGTVTNTTTASASVTVNATTQEATFDFGLPKGANGENAVQFTPSITENGELAWENDGDLPNPPTTPIQTLISTAPLGTVLSFAGSNAPNGYLLCDGASYAVADYEDLYAVIGNTYGGDSTNFNVPNLIDKFIQGSTTSGTEKEAGLPNITGDVGVLWGGANGAFTNRAYDNVATTSSGYNRFTVSLDASRSNAIYGNSDTVQPPALTMVYIIKAFHTNEGTDSGVSDDVVDYVNNSNSYSTEETLTVGKWIDGKPIYRKVYNTTLSTGINVIDATLNIDTYLGCKGSFVSATNNKLSIPWGVTQEYVNVFVDSSGIVKTTSLLTSNNAKIIIEYTKTTD